MGSKWREIPFPRRRELPVFCQFYFLFTHFCTFSTKILQPGEDEQTATTSTDVISVQYVIFKTTDCI